MFVECRLFNSYPQFRQLRIVPNEERSFGLFRVSMLVGERVMRLKRLTGSFLPHGSRSRTQKALYFSFTHMKCVYVLAYTTSLTTYQRVFTDADVRSRETAAKVGRAVKKAYEEAHNAGVSLPPSVELALELMGDNEFGYYFADYDERVIFWFEDLTCEPLMSNVRGVGHKSHLSQCSPYDTTHSIFSHRLAPRVCNRNTVLVRMISVICLFPHLSK
jgi:hypothetical protein